MVGDNHELIKYISDLTLHGNHIDGLLWHLSYSHLNYSEAVP